MSARGRHSRWKKKDKLSDLLDLDSQIFAKQVGFEKVSAGLWSWQFSNRRSSSVAYQVNPGEGVRLIYTSADKPFDYLVSVAATPCTFGGRRWWWLCPHCGRRCRILYCRVLFVCRQCSDAYYETQASKDPLIRIDNELRRLRTQLGAQNLGSDKIPPKPRRMHWHTYMRVATRIADLQYWRLLAFSIDIAKLGESMGIPSPASIDDATEDLRRRMDKKASGSW